jgi:hypothetical protein
MIMGAGDFNCFAVDYGCDQCAGVGAIVWAGAVDGLWVVCDAVIFMSLFHDLPVAVIEMANLKADFNYIRGASIRVLDSAFNER